MASYHGKIRANDLEGGFLELLTDGGEVYRLAGDLEGAEAGQTVDITGKIEHGGFGIHMSGPTIKVQSIQTQPAKGQ